MSKLYDSEPAYRRVFDKFHKTRLTEMVHLDPKDVFELLKLVADLYDERNKIAMDVLFHCKQEYLKNEEELKYIDKDKQSYSWYVRSSLNAAYREISDLIDKKLYQ